MGLRDQIIALIHTNPSISRTGISNGLSISVNTAKEYLSLLKKEGRIIRIGSQRGGYWKIKG